MRPRASESHCPMMRSSPPGQSVRRIVAASSGFSCSIEKRASGALSVACSPADASVCLIAARVSGDAYCSTIVWKTTRATPSCAFRAMQEGEEFARILFHDLDCVFGGHIERRLEPLQAIGLIRPDIGKEAAPVVLS
jgi:hypothetical protein